MEISIIILVLLAFSHALDGQNGQNPTCEALAEGSCQRCEVPVRPNDVSNCPLPEPGKISLCYLDDAVILCSASREKVLCYSVSRCCLQTKFPGRFLTRQMYSRIHNLPYNDVPPTPLSQQCPPNTTSDRDRCCETCRYFSEAPVSVIVDDRPCHVIHPRGSNEYQLVSGAVCGVTGTCRENGCIPETTVNQLVCVQWSNSAFLFTYRIGYAETTAYCSCKNIEGQDGTSSGGMLEPYIVLTIEAGLLCLAMFSSKF